MGRGARSSRHNPGPNLFPLSAVPAAEALRAGAGRVARNEQGPGGWRGTSRGGEGGEERAGRGSHHRKVSPHENSARSSTLPRPATSPPTPPNVTIAPNKAIPAAGALVEIRYLYAYKGGSLYQATYLNERDDIEAGDCVLGQLKYKAEGGEAEGEE